MNISIYDVFLVVGEYSKFVYMDEKFGLGFRRIILGDGSFIEVIGFGYLGVGGLIGFCYLVYNFVIVIILNKLL